DQSIPSGPKLGVVHELLRPAELEWYASKMAEIVFLSQGRINQYLWKPKVRSARFAICRTLGPWRKRPERGILGKSSGRWWAGQGSNLQQDCYERLGEAEPIALTSPSRLRVCQEENFIDPPAYKCRKITLQ